MKKAKTKVSITLGPDVIRAVDVEARKQRASRSSVIEAWLREAARNEQEAELRRATISYYETLTAAARAEDQAIARASARATRRLRVDD